MCCRSKPRAARAQQISGINGGLLSSMAPLPGMSGTPPINTLSGGVKKLALNAQPVQPHVAHQVSTYLKDYKEEYPSEAPPAYERVSGDIAPEVVAREVTNSTYNSIHTGPEVSQQLYLPTQYQTSSQIVKELIEGLVIALSAYQSGAGRHWGVRQAQKALRNELYEEEVARRRAMHGRLRCGERKQIWREVKAINFGY